MPPLLLLPRDATHMVCRPRYAVVSAGAASPLSDYLSEVETLRLRQEAYLKAAKDVAAVSSSVSAVAAAAAAAATATA